MRYSQTDIKAPQWLDHPISTPAETAYLELLAKHGLVWSLNVGGGMPPHAAPQCPCGKAILGRPLGVYLFVRDEKLYANTIYYHIDSRYCDCIPF